KGKEIPVQLENVKADNSGFLKSATLHFIAENVPSIGFDTYYANISANAPEKWEKKFSPEFENDFYFARFSDGGLSSLFDKQLKKELVNPDFLKAGEVFTMKSEGTGAGEFDAIQQPT